MSKVILYSYFRSSCSWRVRIALTLKNIDYEYRAVDILKNVEDRGSISLVSPLGTVPVLEIDGIVIPNSTAILDYLEETYHASPLLPKNATDRMKARAIADSIVSSIQPLQNVSVLKHVAYMKGNTTGKEWGAYYVKKGFQAIEELLSFYSGKYCVGDELSLADICLVPQVFNAAKFDVDMDHFPIIKSINEKLLQLDAFKLTHPFRQPDCPPELKIN